MAKPQWTDAQVFDQMNYGKKWSGSTITYTFPQNKDQLKFDQGEGQGFSVLTAHQQALIRLSLATWNDLVLPSIVPGAIGASDIEFGNTYTAIDYAHAYYPDIGNVWFTSNAADLQNPVVGGYGFATYTHEIGHALGLKHMGDYNGDDDDGPSSYQDSTVLSIMSYYGPDVLRGKGDVAWGDWTGSDGRTYSPQTPMLNDIMVIQQIYGAAVTRADNTIYGFGSTAGGATASIYDFTLNKTPILTIYDSGGVDTLNLSGWGTDSDVDLRPAHFSSVNGMENNLAIARGVIIENAITGGGNDTLHGNSANNILDGGAGVDRAFFSEVFSSYKLNYDLASRHYTVHDTSGVDGTDTLVNIEYAGFENFGGELNDLTPGVHRFYNSNTRAHFFTANNDEASAVTLMDGFQYEGTSFARNVMNKVDSVVVHRFFNEGTGAHFYTANGEEATSLRLAGTGFNYEGAAYKAYAQKTAATTELYRFYNADTGSHFYTADVAEMEHVKIGLAGNYSYEGVAFYVETV